VAEGCARLPVEFGEATARWAVKFRET